MQTKISTLAFVAILFFTSASAQIVNKKDIIAGINISGQTFRQTNIYGKDTIKKHYFNYTPFVSIGIKKNLTAGIYFNMNHTYPTGNFAFKKFDHDWNTGIFLKKYFPIGKKLYAFGEANISYNSFGYTYSKTIEPRYGNGYTVSMNLSGGLGYRISNRVNFELRLNDVLQYGNSASNNFYNNQWNHYNYKGFSLGNPFRGNGVSVGVSVKL